MKSQEHQSPFAKEIAFAGKQLQAVVSSFGEMKENQAQGLREIAYEKAFEFTNKVERLTQTARQLPAYTGHPQAQKRIEKQTLENVPVRAGFTPEGWFCTVIQALLPKKRHGCARYIQRSVFLSLADFFRGKDRVRYKDCVLIFRHIYRRDRPDRHYRDHDNIEVKSAADAVAFFVLYDDGPLTCEHFYCTAAGDENKTEVFVVPRSDFIKWLTEVKPDNDKELILLENRPESGENHM